MQLTDIKWPFDAVKPREVQLRALMHGYGKEGFAYFMRQRLGKTWTAYAEYVLLRQEKKVTWCIIICPNNLKEQWSDAIEQVDPFTPILAYNSQRKSVVEYFFTHNKTGGVFIINYESLKVVLDREGFNLIEKIDTTKTYIVADESTKIKDHAAKMTKAAHELAAACAYKRILTGKPSANSNGDMWAQLKFIDATSRNYYQHRAMFCIVGGFQGRTIVENINTERLKREMVPYSYIAEDKYIKGFEKIYEPIRRINLTGEQLAQYKSMEDDLVLELSSGTKITAPIALVKYLRLQQIGSGIGGDIDGIQHNIVPPDKNPRLRGLMDIIEGEIDHKAIISCRFKQSIFNIQNMLRDAGYKYITIMGGETDLEAKKRLFNEGDVDFVIGQEKSLAYGHTLCATDENPCDSVIFYENSFSLLDRSQTESRPEKMGRDKPISYYDFYASKMDRYMIETLRRKEDASMALMGYSREYGIRPDLNLGTEN